LVIVSTLIFSGCLIEGRIVDENGVGVAGVTVVLSGDESRTTTTNCRGFYKFGDLLNHDRMRAGRYTVTPSHPRYDFAPDEKDITIANKILGGFFWTWTVPWPATGVDFEANDDRFISIRRDEMGIVHIYAATDENAYYGAGYMQAYDRLFQMDLMRRRALGRRAEVLGNSAVSDDILMRHINIAALGKQNAEMITEEYPEYKSLIEAWVEGVNVRIDEVLFGEADLPYGFGIEELDYLPEYWTVYSVAEIFPGSC
ncbi:MAG: penicillin acylase family protein, partial [Deltaproteobacteria bacterium]|nr:penicillin acylase family protein [Deltaproteobacteria bacterium]